jgi:hypothetical protein
MFGYETWLDFLWYPPANPTSDRSISNQPLPAIRLKPFSLGGLRFGDPVANAEFLGRPEKCRRFRAAGNVQLLYARQGLLLEFEAGRFVEAIFHIGTGTYASPIQGAAQCRPRVEGGGDFTATTTIDEFVQILGKPQRIERDKDDGEVVLYYENAAACMEAEFNPQGTLGTWTVMISD